MTHETKVTLLPGTQVCDIEGNVLFTVPGEPVPCHHCKEDATEMVFSRHRRMEGLEPLVPMCSTHAEIEIQRTSPEYDNCCYNCGTWEPIN